MDAAGLAGPEKEVRPDAFRNPGYPLFLSLFIPRSPDHRAIYSILLAQVLISTLTVAVAYRFFRCFLGNGWAETAAVLTALSPHLVAMNIYLLTETLFCFALLAVGWLAVSLVRRPSGLLATALGCALGVANLIRPSLQIFALLLSGFIAIQLRNRSGQKLAIISLVAFLTTIAPWHIRNWVTLGTWSDDGLQISFLHHGIYPDFKYDGRTESYGFPYRFDPRGGEIAQSTAAVLREVCHRFRSAPEAHVVWYLIKKPIAFWSWDIVQGQGDVFVYPVSKSPYWDQPLFRVSHRLMRIVHEPLVLLGLFGCVMAWFPASTRRIGPVGAATVRFTSLLLAYYTALHMIGFPEPRYAVPLRPFLYGMSLFAVGLIYAHLKCRWAARNRQSFSAAQGDRNLAC